MNSPSLLQRFLGVAGQLLIRYHIPEDTSVRKGDVSPKSRLICCFTVKRHSNDDLDFC